MNSGGARAARSLSSISWAEGRSGHYAQFAAEFVRLKVDVIVTPGAAVVAANQATSIIPIVFPDGRDPVGGGLVASLARPGGNVTGFMLFEYGLSPKWLELLKEIAPGITRVAVIRDAAIASESANSAQSGPYRLLSGWRSVR